MLGGGAFAAGGTPGGISDISSIQTSKKLPKGGLQDRQIGAATDQTPSTKGTQLPTLLCDFIGFQQSESVNNAYAGGSGSAGTVRSNIGISYSGATVLNTWNGTGAPSAGVLYNGTNGIITLSDTTNGSGWRQIDLYACNSVTLTVQTFSATNASGTALQTFTIPANIAAAPFSTWTARQFTFAQMAKSVRISGTTDKWGVDNIALTGGCPAPTSSSDDCNGNGLSDACEIAMGLVADCNANGKPDSCDLVGEQGPNLLTNGSLEGYSNSCGGFVTLGSGSRSIPGWTVSAPNNIDWCADRDGTCCAASDGIAFVDLNGSPSQSMGSALTQSVSTEIGKSYRLSAIVVINPFSHSVGFAGDFQLRAGSVSRRFTLTAPPEPWCAYWQKVELDLVAASGTTEVEVRSLIPNTAGGVFVDDVRLRALGASPTADCNANGIPDSCEIANGSAADCNHNGIPDACDIAGGMADCNGNGQLDSCELANGTAIDQNGNGIPDSCDPMPSLTLTANAAACNAVGSTVQVDARLSGVLNLVVAGQLVLDWNPSKLQLLSAGAGDAPYNNLYTVNQSAGQAVILVSAAPGGSGTTAASVIVSRLQFQVLGGRSPLAPTRV
ncbi:MAG: hypothetical protein EBR71_04140 [Planctomycetes bacterium]|nr:hypothetical protein [Planctomycetota bacterium]